MKLKKTSNGTIVGMDKYGKKVEIVAFDADSAVNNVSRDDLDSMIRGSHGQFVTVTFTKRNGDLRVMNGRLGVKKHLKGGENLAVKSNPNLRILFDTVRGQYRSFDITTVIGAKVGGKVYRVNN